MYTNTIKTRFERKKKMNSKTYLRDCCIRLCIRVGRTLMDIKNIIVRGRGINQSVLVDADDYDKVSKYTWVLCGSGSWRYASTKIDGVMTRMHHFILGRPQIGFVVDHIDHDIYNNTKQNLRFATYSQNAQNKRKCQNASSEYSGVSFTSINNKWRASCKGIFLGEFDDEKAAAVEYDLCAYYLFGPHAKTNELVQYSNSKNYVPPDRRQRKYDLPKYISYREDDGRYLVRIMYNKRVYRYNASTLDKAELKLQQFQAEIKELKKLHDDHHASLEITRNADGLAIVHLNGTAAGYAIVDEERWHELSKVKWFFNADGYVLASGNKSKSSISVTSMHKYLLKNDNPDMVIDHINHVRHDNRLMNLRIVPKSTNSHNRKKKKGVSMFAGVSRNNDLWSATISHKGESFHLGSFLEEEFAALAYNEKAVEIYGECANLNLIDDYVVRNFAEFKRQNPNRKSTKCKSIYIGVSVDCGRFRMRITHEGKRISGGYFDSELEAALAYNKRALELMGEKAKLNVIL